MSQLKKIAIRKIQGFTRFFIGTLGFSGFLGKNLMFFKFFFTKPACRLFQKTQVFANPGKIYWFIISLPTYQSLYTIFQPTNPPAANFKYACIIICNQNLLRRQSYWWLIFSFTAERYCSVNLFVCTRTALIATKVNYKPRAGGILQTEWFRGVDGKILSTKRDDVNLF